MTRSGMPSSTGCSFTAAAPRGSVPALSIGLNCSSSDLPILMGMRRAMPRILIALLILGSLLGVSAGLQLTRAEDDTPAVGHPHGDLSLIHHRG